MFLQVFSDHPHMNDSSISSMITAAIGSTIPRFRLVLKFIIAARDRSNARGIKCTVECHCMTCRQCHYLVGQMSHQCAGGWATFSHASNPRVTLDERDHKSGAEACEMLSAKGLEKRSRELISVRKTAQTTSVVDVMPSQEEKTIKRSKRNHHCSNGDEK